MSQTLEQLKETTGNSFAHKSYLPESEGGPAVVGKFAICEPLHDGFWDVWLCNTEDMAAGIGTRKLNNIISAIEVSESSATGPLRRLDGEAVYARMPTDVLLRIHRLLGIRTRRKATPTSFKKGGRNHVQ